MVSPPKRSAIRRKIKQASRLTKFLKWYTLLSSFIFHLDNALNSKPLNSTLDWHFFSIDCIYGLLQGWETSPGNKIFGFWKYCKRVVTYIEKDNLQRKVLSLIANEMVKTVGFYP